MHEGSINLAGHMHITQLALVYMDTITTKMIRVSPPLHHGNTPLHLCLLTSIYVCHYGSDGYGLAQITSTTELFQT